jgi:hypothetical protein
MVCVLLNNMHTILNIVFTLDDIYGKIIFDRLIG